jgi:hypothetical protein
MGNTCSKHSQEALGEGEREMLLKEVKNEKDRRIWAEKKFNEAYSHKQQLVERVLILERRVAELEGRVGEGGRRSSI